MIPELSAVVAHSLEVGLPKSHHVLWIAAQLGETLIGHGKLVIVMRGHRRTSSVHVAMSNWRRVCRLGKAAGHEVSRVLQDANALRHHRHVEGLAASHNDLGVQTLLLLVLLDF